MGGGGPQLGGEGAAFVVGPLLADEQQGDAPAGGQLLGSGQQDVLPFVRGEVADQGGDEVVGGDVQAGAGGLAPGRVGVQAGEVDAVVEDDAFVGQVGELLLRRLADAEEAADVGQAAGLAHQGQRAAIVQDVVDVPEDGAAAEQGGQGAPEEGAAAVGVEELGV